MKQWLLLVWLACTGMNTVSADDRPGGSAAVLERSNPAGVFDPGQRFSHVVRVRGGDLLFLSGQVAFNEQGQLVGESDLRIQTEQTFRNIASLLDSHGIDFSNVIKLTIYIVNYQDEDRLLLHEIQSRFVDPNQIPASTLLGVQSLARPGILIEVDVVAVI